MCPFCFCKQVLGFSKCDIPLNLKKEKEQAWIAQGCNPRSAWKSIFKFVAQKGHISKMLKEMHSCKSENRRKCFFFFLFSPVFFKENHTLQRRF